MATIISSRPTPSGQQLAVQSNMAQSHPFTCNSCLVAFRNSDLQRSHMRTDWHRYNLKRKVAELPPLSSEVFSEKVLNAQASNSAVAAKASYTKFCEACQRKYYSENQYENHLRGQRHMAKTVALATNGQPSVDEDSASVMSSTISLGGPIVSVDDKAPETIDPEVEAEFSKVVNGIKETTLDDEDITEKEPVSRRPTRPHHSAGEEQYEHPLSPQNDGEKPATDVVVAHSPGSTARCLFCNQSFSSLETNVLHMTRAHGLFIPEQSYLVDLGGLIKWLHERIYDLHECLYCHKVKGSTEGVQTHMRDKGHCMIAFETEEEMIEVGQFYDFRSTYSDSDSEEDEMMENDIHGGVKLHSSMTPTTIISDENGDQEMANAAEDGEGWETDSSESSTDDPTSAPKSQSSRSPAAYQIDHELHLPSGRIAGHRSLARYYRQNLHNYPTPGERLVQQQRLLTNGTADRDTDGDQQMTDGHGAARGRQVATTRANGGSGMLGVTDELKREVRAVEKREVKRAQRAERKYQWGVDKRGNSQKHFRDPLLQ